MAFLTLGVCQGVGVKLSTYLSSLISEVELIILVLNLFAPEVLVEHRLGMFWGLWFPHFELSGMVPLVRGLLGVVQSPIIKAMAMLLKSLPELYELYEQVLY